MKVVAFQPAYPHCEKDMPNLVSWLLDSLDSCNSEMDLIVLPEACNAMSEFETVEAFYASAAKYAPLLIEKVKETAIRCQALVAINLYAGEDKKYANVTQIYGKDGSLIGSYYKQHLPISEAVEKKIVSDYTKSYHVPYTIDVEGVRYAFLTCYDCYFTEYIQHIATRRPDVLIVSSLQRGETMDMLSVEMKLAAFICNSHLVRSSVSMGGADYKYGASTMVVSPKGEILKTIGQDVGILECEIDPKMKHYRPNTYNHPDIPNHQFVENGRTPWAYRTCGAGTRPGEKLTGYPRICAHRGFNTIAPENSMASLGLAVALGAEEIEIDVWPSRDGELVVCHDESVDRTSDGSGVIMDMDWKDIASLDIGKKLVPWSEKESANGEVNTGVYYTGLRFPRLQDVLAKFSRQVIINLHIKTPSGKEGDMYDPIIFKKIVDLIYEYDMQDHVYIAGEEDVLKAACEIAPELPRAALDGKLDFKLVKLAKKYNCQKLQLFKGYYNQEMIAEAKEAGIRCNLFWSDEPENVAELLECGIDTILTNDYLRMAEALKIQVQKING